MDRQLALDKQKQLKISLLQIVQEEYEMLLLKSIFESNFGIQLVFRGGTALRLAYGSPRFSDDLDFTQLSRIDAAEFEEWSQATARSNPNLEVVEVMEKYYTLLAQFRVKDPILSATISIKIEISKRKSIWKKERDYLLLQLESAVTPLTVLAQVATLRRIQQEKLAISPRRIRDIFDLWFINQKLREPTPMDFGKFSVKQVQQELHRLLPEGERRLLEKWLSKR